MKKLYTLLTAVILTASTYAQAPEKMSYQSVVRDAGDALLTNQAVGMQISILQGSISGTPVYVETQTPTTNINGLVSIEIGSGTVVSGTFSTIGWSNGPYFIKTETDPTGGTNYTITGTSQLMSVPYALHAKTADSIVGGITLTETDPVFGASAANGITGTDITNWDNKLDSEVDYSVTNEIQSLSIAGNDLSITSGNSVSLPAKVTIVSNAIDASVITADLIVNRLKSVGKLQLRATVIGLTTAYINIAVPSSINGVEQKLESVTVAYKTDNALSYITETRMKNANTTGGATTRVIDATDQASTTWTTYTVTDLAPDPIIGTVILQIQVYHGGTGVTHDIEIGPISVTLTD
ncbi:MAG: hypothetical protein ABFS10_11745 [Bacteroidota bacterium]